MSPDIDLVRAALARLDAASDFDMAQDALADFGRVIDLPVLSWAPDVSRPVFDAWMDAFMRRQGWSEAVLATWWDRTVMLKSPLYVRCRTRALPFITIVRRGEPGLSPETRTIHAALADMGLISMITVPVHLPKGQVAQVTFGGALDEAGVEAVLRAVKTELVAAGLYFMHAFARVVGDRPTPEEARSNLTPREWECLRLTAQGHREAEVAVLLDLRPSTVRFHLRNAERKLGASTRTHAVALAAQLGLLGPISG